MSTRCEDRLAAELVAVQLERARVIIEILKEDQTGAIARMVAEHLSAKGHKVKDKAPIGAKGRVYFVECPARNLIKIGFATDITARLRTLRTAATDSIHLLGSFAGTRRDERRLHGQFMKHRKFGEWFADCPEIREAMATLVSRASTGDGAEIIDLPVKLA